MSRLTTLQISTAGLSQGNETQLTDIAGSVVIVGANGSGKTRLGVWFEYQSSQQSLVRRVSAQKSLSFPDSVSPSSLQDARDALDIGIDVSSFIGSRQQYLSNISAYRRGNKWKGKPETALVDDFSNLLVYLVSEQYEVSLSYTQNAKQQFTYSTPPDTKLDQIKRIWEQVLPHKELVLQASTVKVKPKDAPTDSIYQASAMSDGERVAFYLIGQCLSTPTGAIIVVDEPEVHLHRVIQARLWDAIEQERPDCLFVYLTHDLDFAASRTEATKIWLKDFDGQVWNWLPVPKSEGLPEEVLLAVLGSRKPVLFTEGDRGGFEQAIFSRIYPGWTIIPRGYCNQVIEATQAFTALKHLHGIDCRGIIDLDYRTPREVAHLLEKGVHVLEIQEIESLLLTENVLAAVATHAITSGMVSGVASEVVNDVKEFTLGLLARDQELLTSRKTAWEIEKQLHKIDSKALGMNALSQAVADAARIDVRGVYTAFEQEINHVISTKDFPALLRLYNNKGLAKQVGKFFGTLSYPDLVKRLISGGNGETIVQALRAASPVLTQA